MKKYWSEDEMNFIKKNISNMSTKELAIKFGVPYQKMNDKIHRMGLNRKRESGELWSNEGDELLRTHYEYAPKNYLMRLFPNRSWKAIFERGRLTLKLNRKTQDRYSINYNYFDEWNHDSAYIFGFISADGHLFYNTGNGNRNGLQFEIANYDVDILEKIKKVMEFEGPIIESKRNTVKLQINNTKIIKDLLDKGIPADNKTFTIEYPKGLPDEFSRDYIRGLFDGDGCVYKHGMAVRFELLGTESLLKSVLNKLPIDNKNYKIQNRNSSGSNVFAVQIGGVNALKIFKWIYDGDGIYLERKRAKLKNILLDTLNKANLEV